MTGPDLAARVARDHRRFADGGLPRDLPAYLLEEYALDVSARYAGRPIRNPWGKGSGQLSMKRSQVDDAIDAGLGFVVLKTVIAQNDAGERSMKEWAIREARMVAEPIVGAESGRTGWTVSWKGRGWWDGFDDYLTLVREATARGGDAGVVVAPSVKYHLPGAGEHGWRTGEYETTTRAILAAYRAGGGVGPMPLEKDFSPTLAGSDLVGARAVVLDWLERVPDLMRGATEPGSVAVGLKLFNATDDDGFQLDLLEAVHTRSVPDFIVYANRLFDPNRVFDGKRGIAYGGPDLGDRNLRLLGALRAGQGAGTIPRPPLEISGTGDISSGRRAVQYAWRGCTSFQIHTLFQLPDNAYPMRRGSRLDRAMHLLHFDPVDGFIVSMREAADRLGLGREGPVRLLELAARGAESDLGQFDTEPGQVTA